MGSAAQNPPQQAHGVQAKPHGRPNDQRRAVCLAPGVHGPALSWPSPTYLVKRRLGILGQTRNAQAFGTRSSYESPIAPPLRSWRCRVLHVNHEMSAPTSTRNCAQITNRVGRNTRPSPLPASSQEAVRAAGEGTGRVEKGPRSCGAEGLPLPSHLPVLYECTT